MAGSLLRDGVGVLESSLAHRGSEGVGSEDHVRCMVAHDICWMLENNKEVGIIVLEPSAKPHKDTE